MTIQETIYQICTMLEDLYLLIFNDIIILAAETPLSVLEALWKKPLEGVSYHSSLIVPASLKAFRRSSSIVLNPGFLQNISDYVIDY